MRLSTRHGRLRLLLDPVEVQLLGGLIDDLEAVLEREGDDDPVVQRLHPSAYPDDDEAAAEFRSMTESVLRGERDERLTAVRADLAGVPEDGVAAVELTDPDDGERWIRVLNDLRLALGTRLDVHEGDSAWPDPTDPQAGAREIYSWLTAVQDTVVQGLMG
jgi:hypothetical protein